MKKRITFLSVLVIFSIIVFFIQCGSSSHLEWVRTFGSTKPDAPYGLVADRSGAYITGSYYIIETVDSSTQCLALMKYNPDGILEWVDTYKNGYAQSRPILYQSGKVKHIYLMGITKAVGDSNDYLTQKYRDNDGLAWSNVYTYFDTIRVDTTRIDTVYIDKDDNPHGLAVDSDANVYITGSSYNDDTDEILTIKYDKNGNELWKKRYPDDESAKANGSSVAVLDNFVYVFGSIGDPSDFITLKYDALEGDLLQKHIFDNGNGYRDDSKSMAFDSDKNLYITGTAWNDEVDLSLNRDIITAKYQNGDLSVPPTITRYNYEDADRLDEGMQIITKAGFIYVLGISCGSTTESDIVLIKYDPDLTEVKNVRYNNTPVNKADWAYRFTMDDYGNLYLAGSSQSIDDKFDIITLKYDADLELQWLQRYDSGGINDIGLDIALSNIITNHNDIYVIGRSVSELNDADHVLLKYSE